MKQNAARCVFQQWVRRSADCKSVVRSSLQSCVWQETCRTPAELDAAGAAADGPGTAGGAGAGGVAAGGGGAMSSGGGQGGIPTRALGSVPDCSGTRKRAGARARARKRQRARRMADRVGWIWITSVLSMLCHSSSRSVCNPSNSRVHVPFFDHRSNRLNTVFHGPNSTGRSRHGTPVRRHHKTASTNFRLSFPRRPGAPSFCQDCSDLRPLPIV